MAGESILFVDDEEQIRKLVTTYLDRHGYSVRAATDGIEALKQIAASPPDLLITDVRMPNLDGLELTHRIRASRANARLPIIMLSAFKETHDVLAGYGKGADEYVPKPVEMAVLGAKVEGLLRRARETVLLPTRRGAVIAFLHGKGGVGATTLAVNAGVVLSKPEHSRVVLVDLNRDFANAELLLDILPEHRVDELAMYDSDELDPSAVLPLLTPYASGLSVLAGPATPEAGERLSPTVARMALDRLREEADFVLVDLDATFSDVSLAALDAADAVCVVTSPGMAALKATRDCLRILRKLDVIPADRMVVVLNCTTPGDLDEQRVVNGLDYVPDVIIPYNASFLQAADQGRPFVTWRQLQPSGRAIIDLATRIEGWRARK